MELEGAKHAFSYLQSVGLAVVVFISDRHRDIAKWIRESQPGWAHYFDIWHIARSIGKMLLQLDKEGLQEDSWLGKRSTQLSLLVCQIHQGRLPGDDHSQMEIFYGACYQQTW